jgi:arylamine N-acetyltransferase
LGFRVKMAAARAAKANRGEQKGVFDGWNHLNNLVEFEGRRYLVDVEFGANSKLFPYWWIMVSLTAAGPAAPIPLVDGIEVPWGSTNDRKRLIWSSIPEFETPEKCWNLQHKREGNEEWDDIYCFAEVECLPQDIRGHGLEKYKECSEKLQPDDSLCTNCGEEEDVVV